jgi:hypothetical protein
MRSSTSSSEAGAAEQRQTAADRPGVAQPVPLRPVPAQPWGRILWGAVALSALLVGAWEWGWRGFGAVPGLRNTNGLFAIERRRIDAGEGDATVLAGASRIYFDVQLPVWERLAGRAPIQLAFEGTTPLGTVEDLAADPRFTGRLIIEVAPDVFFSGYEYHGGAPRYAHQESPAQRIGQWLSMRFIEPYLAFDDPDFALREVLDRLPWPERPGRRSFLPVRKLAVLEPPRNMHMWRKVETDLAYRDLARRVWAQDFEPAEGDPTPAEALKTEREQIARAARAVATLRARGVEVLFLRPPSSGRYLAYEQRDFPRGRTWDALLAATGTRGIYFQDYPELSGYECPEWSHLSRADAERFTAALYAIIVRDFWKPVAADRTRAAAHGAAAAGGGPVLPAPTPSRS